MLPLFQAIEEATEWQKIEELLGKAYCTLARLHNALEITPPIEAKTQLYHQRPYRVLNCGRIADALRGTIGSDTAKAFPRGYGAVWQSVDSDILLCDARFLAAYRALL
jgi:hypothetical protein